MDIPNKSFIRVEGFSWLKKINQGFYRIEHGKPMLGGDNYVFYAPRGRKPIVRHYAEVVDQRVVREDQREGNDRIVVLKDRSQVGKWPAFMLPPPPPAPVVYSQEVFSAVRWVKENWTAGKDTQLLESLLSLMSREQALPPQLIQQVQKVISQLPTAGGLGRIKKVLQEEFRRDRSASNGPLRKQVIRLAHANPGPLQDALLRLL